MQPEAGPSRLPAATNIQPLDSPGHAPQSNPSAGTFSSGVDFIAFVDSDDDRPKQPTREWDRGKSERDKRERERDGRNRDRDGQAVSKKRRWEDSERDDVPAGKDSRRASTHNVNLKSRKAPWAADVDWDSCRNVAQMLHAEVEAFLYYISPSPVEHEVREMIVQLISSSIKKTYPDASILPFGSFETKLYLPSGDIDLVVQSDSIAYSDRVSSLRSLANIVRRTGITDKVTVIAKAKVPIIKFVTTYGRFSVDISLNQTNGVQAGKMINRFLDEFPALRALVLVIKSFLNQRSMNEVYSGGLGSYAIVCLAVSFLQMHPKLRRAEIDPARNLGVLVMEFFELYGKYFNYSETGISLRHGGSYFSKARRGWMDYNKRYLLSIEDPGDISNDISRGSFGIKSVRQTFAGAHEIMKSAATGPAVDLRRGRSDPEEMSVLSGILGEVYDSGALARLLASTRSAPRLQPSSANVRVNGNGNIAAAPTTNGSKRAREAQSVTAAWGEADMVLDSDEEAGRLRDYPPARDRGRRADSRRVGRDKDGSESESRYDIAKGARARKRRRTGQARRDLRAAVFLTDSELDDEDGEVDQVGASEYAPGSSDDSLQEIEQAYSAADKRREIEQEEESSTYLKGKGKGRGVASGSESRGAQNLQNSGAQRLAYWASKGLRGDGVDSDSVDSVQKSLSNDQRRAYWASKGLRGGDIHSDSS
ncbi:hypothetical protein DFH11DRAFT_1578575 [Phellopilus nigrolimitatus]|nr:hypothetical protein DFH11DRAFT_1578575 [Phellopilus nigrolimitatus]